MNNIENCNQNIDTVNISKETILKKLNEYTEKYPDTIELLKIAGVHPDSQKPMSNPYLKTEELDKENFGNIGLHCVSVAMFVESIANEIGVQKKDIDKIIKRALIHDATKRFEIFRKKAQIENEMDDAYTQTAYDSIFEVLKEKNIAPEIIEELRNAGKETGHLSLKQFLLIDKGRVKMNQKITLDELLIHIADDMSSSVGFSKESVKISYTTVQNRMNKSDFENRYPFLYKEGVGFDDKHTPIDTSNSNLNNFKIYAEWQIWICKEICKKIQKKIDSDSAIDPEQFILEIVRKNLDDISQLRKKIYFQM